MKAFKVLYRGFNGELCSQIVRGESAEIVEHNFVSPAGDTVTVVSVKLYTFALVEPGMTMAPATL